MSLQKIRFSELDFKYDTDRLLKELNILKFVQYLTDASTHTNHYKMPIFNQSQIKNCKIWKGINLTNPPDSVFIKNSSLSKIRNENSELEWVWVKEFPYMQYIVKSLGFLKTNLVRVLVLEPGSIGPVHNDNSTGSYYNVNRTSITLNISDGGSPLVFLNGNEIHSKMPGPTFLFRDDCWHGIPETKTQRFQVRINGMINETVNKLLLQNTIMEII
jgi:hypothetical protein